MSASRKQELNDKQNMTSKTKQVSPLTSVNNNLDPSQVRSMVEKNCFLEQCNILSAKKYCIDGAMGHIPAERTFKS